MNTQEFADMFFDEYYEVCSRKNPDCRVSSRGTIPDLVWVDTDFDAEEFVNIWNERKYSPLQVTISYIEPQLSLIIWNNIWVAEIYNNQLRTRRFPV